MNQVIAARREPKTGLKTLPAVFAVSMMPSPLLMSLSFLYISPTVGITTGKAPAAPRPCINLPARIRWYGLSTSQEARPQTPPPVPANERAGINVFFLPKRSDRKPAIGMNIVKQSVYADNHARRKWTYADFLLYCRKHRNKHRAQGHHQRHRSECQQIAFLSFFHCHLLFNSIA